MLDSRAVGAIKLNSAATGAPKRGGYRQPNSLTTFVCMTKINHCGVGVTKLRDDIVGCVCDSHTAPFSKMAAISTISRNKVIDVANMAYSASKSTFPGSRNAMVTSKMQLGE